MTAYRFGLFVSYASADKAFVRKVLVPALERLGISKCIDYANFRPGSPWITESERCVAESQYTLAVVSPNYLRDGRAELESMLAKQLGLERGAETLLLVTIEPCRTPAYLSGGLALTEPEAAEAVLRTLLTGRLLSN